MPVPTYERFLGLIELVARGRKDRHLVRVEIHGAPDFFASFFEMGEIPRIRELPGAGLIVEA